MSDERAAPREIEIRIRTVGGHEHQLSLPEDAVELRQLFTALVKRGAGGTADSPAVVQLPIDGGSAACTLAAEHIVSVVTSPPVLVQIEEEQPPPQQQLREPIAEGAPPVLHRSRYLIVDDFLSVDEHQDMLALAVRERSRFQPGTVAGKESLHRNNSVILDFNQEAHATLLSNRLLVWFPLFMQSLGERMFPLKTIEAQLTAGNDGDYYKAHLDTDGNTADFRALTCIYYFFREPKGFSGGGLRLYDKIDYGGRIQQAETFQEIQPVSNRLLVFSSENYHELRPIRCPSRELADSRFAVTTWFHKSGRPDPSVPFGWGHFRCGDVPAAFRSLEQAR